MPLIFNSNFCLRIAGATAAAAIAAAGRFGFPSHGTKFNRHLQLQTQPQLQVQLRPQPQLQLQLLGMDQKSNVFGAPGRGSKIDRVENLSGSTATDMLGSKLGTTMVFVRALKPPSTTSR